MKQNNLDVTFKKKMIGLASARFSDGCYKIPLDKALSSFIANLKIGEIPKGISLMITYNAGVLFFNIEGRESFVHRCKAIPYSMWTHEYSVITYGNKMAEVIQQWADREKIEFDQTISDSDGENFDIWYYVKLDEDVTIETAINYIRNLEKELEGQTEITLRNGNIDKSMLKDERAFSLNVLLPLFRKMGYHDAKYNHGPREFGKDIVFSHKDALGIRRNFGVQVKAGNITGEAGSEFDKLIAQIDDAFEMAYLDIYSKTNRHLTDLIIAVSGRFVGNAPQKICEKTKKENIHFWDIDKIQGLLEKYMSAKIE